MLLLRDHHHLLLNQVSWTGNTEVNATFPKTTRLGGVIINSFWESWSFCIDSVSLKFFHRPFIILRTVVRICRNLASSCHNFSQSLFLSCYPIFIYLCLLTLHFSLFTQNPFLCVFRASVDATVERLLAAGGRHQKQLKASQEERAVEEMKEATFAPSINEKSLKIASLFASCCFKKS